MLVRLLGGRAVRMSDVRSADSHVVVFRPAVFEGLVLPAIGASAFVWIGIYQLTMQATSERLIGAVCILVGAMYPWFMTARVRLAVGDNLVVVRNPFRSTVIRLEEISDVQPEYEGLKIRTADGRSVTALAVQRWNLSLFLGRRSRADQVADLIRKRRDENGRSA